MIAIDADYTVNAISNSGFGIGVNYERKITDFLSIRPGIGSMYCWSEPKVFTVGSDVPFYYYPYKKGLDKLYIGFGPGFDLITYPKNSSQSKDFAVSLAPIVGWKFQLSKRIMFEPTLSYRFQVWETNNYERTNDYVLKGFLHKLSFKFFIGN